MVKPKRQIIHHRAQYPERDPRGGESEKIESERLKGTAGYALGKGIGIGPRAGSLGQVAWVVLPLQASLRGQAIPTTHGR